MAKAETFLDEFDSIEVELVKRYGQDIWQVRRGERLVVRHRDRLVPLDDEAKRLLDASE